jgi:hypothetical protein
MEHIYLEFLTSDFGAGLIQPKIVLRSLLRNDSRLYRDRLEGYFFIYMGRCGASLIALDRRNISSIDVSSGPNVMLLAALLRQHALSDYVSRGLAINHVLISLGFWQRLFHLGFFFFAVAMQRSHILRTCGMIDLGCFESCGFARVGLGHFPINLGSFARCGFSYLPIHLGQLAIELGGDSLVKLEVAHFFPQMLHPVLSCCSTHFLLLDLLGQPFLLRLGCAGASLR